MASVNVPRGNAWGGEIFDHHFGVNYISVKDEAEGGGALPAYENAVNDLAGGGRISVRFPGGGVAEDKVNPLAYTVLDDGRVEPGTHTWEFLEDAARHGWGVSIVLPTWKFLDLDTMEMDTATAKREVQRYAESLFEAADELGVTIDGFEIGNEFDLLAEKTNGGAWLNADEMVAFSEAYAEISAAITMVLDEEINDAGFAAGDDAPWIGVQALWTWVPSYWRKSVDFRDAMEAAFTAAGATDAVDALITHIYPWLELEQNPQDWLEGDTEIIGNFAALDAVFGGGLDWNVTEWEVSFGSGDAVALLKEHYDGIKQLEPVVSLFSQMIAAGIDHMNLWPVRNGAFTSLETLEGAEKPISYLFDMMSDQLPGTRVLDLNGSDPGNMWEVGKHVHVYGFEGDGRTVLYLGSRSDKAQVLDLSLDAYKGTGGLPMIEVSRISVDDPDAKGYLQGTHVETQEYSFRWFENNAEDVLTFSPYEMIVVELVYETERGERETGTDGEDFLFGSTGGDELWGKDGVDWIHGRMGADRISGGGGNDVIDGGAQADLIYGGEGDDVVDGGAGQDVVYLGNGDDLFRDNGQGRFFGDDVIDGGWGDDIIEIGSGCDVVTGGQGADRFVFGTVSKRFDEDRITDFTIGEDILEISGKEYATLEDLAADFVLHTDGHDTFVHIGGTSWIILEGHDASGLVPGDLGGVGTTVRGSQDNDRLDGTPYDSVIFGQLGNDTLCGGLGEDILRGGDGADWLFGGDGRDDLLDGRGSDELFGGAGADRFRLYLDGQTDRINDFEQGLDKIDLMDWRVGRFGDLEISARNKACMEIEFEGERLLVQVDASAGFSFAASDFLL